MHQRYYGGRGEKSFGRKEPPKGRIADHQFTVIALIFPHCHILVEAE